MVCKKPSGSATNAKAMPSCPPNHSGSMSEEWVQQELAIAARNAEKNRRIKSCGDVCHSNRRKILSSSTEKQAVVPNCETLIRLNQNTKGSLPKSVVSKGALQSTEHSVINGKLHTNADRPDLGSDVLSSLNNLIIDWSGAIKSIFPEQTQTNQLQATVSYTRAA